VSLNIKIDKVTTMLDYYLSLQIQLGHANPVVDAKAPEYQLAFEEFILSRLLSSAKILQKFFRIVNDDEHPYHKVVSEFLNVPKCR
jgi:hypothetical protein